MSHSAPRVPRLGGRATLWILFLTLLFTYMYFAPDPGSNGDVRMALVRALIEDHRTQIDRVQTDDMGDKSWFNGHYYSSKPPGTSLLALPVYAGYFTWLKAVYGDSVARQQTPKQQQIGLYLSTLAAVRIPSALAVTFFFVVTYALCQDRLKALFATAVLGLGSLAFPYSVVFFNHQLTAGLLFLAFGLLALERRRVGSPHQEWRTWPTVLAGFAAGYAVVTDPTVAPAVLVLAAYLLWVAPSRNSLLPFILGGVLPAAVLAAYDWVSFGAPFDVGYSHNADPLAQQQMGTGFFGYTYPRMDVLLQIIGGTYRGFLLLSPVLILSGVGMYQMWRRRLLRPELAASAAIVAIVLLMNAAYFPWDGDYSLGVRRIVHMMFFLCLPLPFALGKRLGIATVLLVISIVHMLAGATFSPLVPPTYANTLVDYLYAQLVSRAAWAKIPPNVGWVLHLHGPASLVPLVVIWFIAAALLLWPRRHEPDRPLTA